MRSTGSSVRMFLRPMRGLISPTLRPNFRPAKAPALASAAPTIAIHYAVGYKSLSHLAPVYLALLLSATGLALSHEYLTSRDSA